MPKFNVHVYREMRLYYPEIEATTPEDAAKVARDFLTGDAKSIDDCEGQTFAALVDTVGDEDFTQTQLFDF